MESRKKKLNKAVQLHHIMEKVIEAVVVVALSETGKFFFSYSIVMYIRAIVLLFIFVLFDLFYFCTIGNQLVH